MRAVLGIDVGLSSVRAAVVAADGRLLGHARSSQPPLRGTGRDAERHVTDWTAAIPRVVRDSLVAAGSPPIEMIGIGALGPCPVMLDAGGMALGSVPLFSLEAGAEANDSQTIYNRGAGDLVGPADARNRHPGEKRRGVESAEVVAADQHDHAPVRKVPPRPRAPLS